jgi:N-glycosylase/DNA lyase
MRFIEKNNTVILKGYNSFDIGQTLECGQCFRFEKKDDDKYTIIAHGRMITIEQKKGEMRFYPCTDREFKEIWINYFDLNTDYSKIKKVLSKNDEVLSNAIEYGSGIRLLNQDPWECLISFIISQNNRISMIKQVIQNLCEKYGDNLGEYYSFPEPKQLIDKSIDDIMLCKTGFRAKYIIDAANKINDNTININDLKDKNLIDLKEELMSIKGVGPKVADCVILFACGKREAFPTDVWIKRIMQHFYFNDKESTVGEIHKYASSHWGDYSGFAQQYLFNYAIKEKIGV